ncbi:MFS transporter, partial [Streptomyces sp. TRM76130]|nr:MFS transporter [Streptomyces sp. TRM76130]
LAATAGGGLAFVVRIAIADTDAAVVTLGAVLYLCGALASLRMAADLLGPDRALIPHRLATALTGTTRDLVAGVHHVAAPPRREAAWSLAAMTLMRFCYGA